MIIKYLDLFAGIGGFPLGIQQAYEEKNISGNGEQQENSEASRKRFGVGAKIIKPNESEVGRDNSCNGYSDEDKGFNTKRNKEKQESVSPKRSSSGVESNQRRNIKSEPSCIGYSEIDKYAIQIYEQHFNHKNYGDIKRIRAEELPDFDLICGGFPCQSFSIAGKREGFEDTRGTLFFDIARIIKAKRPRLVFLENVKGLLSHDDGRTFNTIILTLDELGYDLQWQVLNSKNFGVPQNRERVFIIEHSRGTPRPKVFPFGESDGIFTESGGKRSLENKSSAITKNYHKGVHSGGETYIQQLNNPTHSNNRIYGEDGISPSLNTAQGGNRQPFIKQVNPSKESGGKQPYQQNRIYNSKGGVPALNAELGGRMNVEVKPVLTPDRPKKRQQGRRVKEDGEPSFTVTGQDQHGVMVGSKIRRLTPIECARLQGFPDDWHDGVSDSQAYKVYGNAVTVNVIREIVKRML